ncbi:MAG TPA: DUF4337 family protein [Candidatus Sulfotelmatobacter sp.]|nr:DUF4337 family protein [Candidatus Sulfotelmatobacter sp.]
MSETPADQPVSRRVRVPEALAPEGTQHHDAPHWIPVAAAVLALCSAVSGFLASTLQSEALLVKNEQIAIFTRAADTFNEYEAGRIKVAVYRAAIDSGNAKHPDLLAADAKREEAKGPPLLRSAAEDKKRSEAEGERSEHLATRHRWVESGTTLFEIAIVLVSITALAGSRLLPITAAIATACGLVVDTIGMLI